MGALVLMFCQVAHGAPVELYEAAVLIRRLEVSSCRQLKHLLAAEISGLALAC